MIIEALMEYGGGQDLYLKYFYLVNYVEEEGEEEEDVEEEGVEEIMAGAIGINKFNGYFLVAIFILINTQKVN